MFSARNAAVLQSGGFSWKFDRSRWGTLHFSASASLAVTDSFMRKSGMRTREIIVCSECKKTHCTVEELFEPEKLSMEEYARRYGKTFPMNFYSSGRTARRFLITCQDCGYQYEFLERIEGSQTIPASDYDAYKVTYSISGVTNHE